MKKNVLKVLILEDNPFDAELNLKALHKESWTVESRIASDEISFCEYLEDFDPDVILSDYNLPVFNGIDALLIAKERKSLTPFIIVTGSLDEETAVDCIKQGAWDYVLKEHLIRLNPAIKFAIELREERFKSLQTSQSLSESEEHYRALAENSADVIMRFDKNGRHLFVNSAISKQTGLKPDLFLNKTHHEMGLFEPSMCDFWEEHIFKVFKTKQSTEVEFSLPKPNGKVYIEWRLFPEFNSDGEVMTVLAVARDISYKIETQNALKISEERLQLAHEGTSDGIWDWDLKTNNLFFSPHSFTLLGYQPDDIQHDINKFSELIHPDDIEPAYTYVKQIASTGEESIEMEIRLRRKDGTYAWILSRGKVLKIDGVPVRIVGTNVDISIRKRQDAIRESIFEIGNAVVTTRNLQELYEKIQEILGQIVDTKNCYIALYDKEKDLISLPFHRDEKDKYVEFPAGKTLTAYVIRSGKAQLVSKERDRELIETGEIEVFGTPAFSWLGVPLKFDDIIFGVFTVQSYDESVKYTEEDVKILEFVSDQIALAISRKKDEDSIRENEQKQRRIIESSPDGLIVTDHDGIITDHNTSILNILQIRNKQLKNSEFFEYVIPAEQEKAKRIFLSTSKSGYQKNIELKMLRKDGTEFYAEVSLGLIQNTGIVTETFVIIIKDITERVNYESNLKIAKEKAEESDRLKSAFLSNMSHEIRTPMNAIIGFAELLSQNNLNDDDKKEFIVHINHGTENLLNLIDDIIDISKIEAGQIRINNSVVRISSVFSELQNLFLKILKRQGRENLTISIENNGFDPDLNISADPFRLKQVFLNLLNNAVKFTETGGVTFGIKSIDKKQIQFYVKDTGIGINQNNQKMIFDRFRQGHESKTKFYGGTGLGLAISKHLVELMDGEISVFSEPGVGSEFIFTIAFVKPDCEIVTSKGKTFDPNPDWAKKTILIAEDESSNYLVLKEALKSTNIKLLWAKNGNEAVDMYKIHPEIDLVLMDIQLPGKDGYQATSEIKSIRKGTPVIAQTAYAMSGEREKSLDAGCDEYIAKPIRSKQLIALLSEFLD